MKENSVRIFLFKIMPKSLFSRIFGCFACLRLPSGLLKAVIRWYCRTFSVNMDDYIIPENGYATLDEFFTRGLKPGARKTEKGNVLVSPVDARVDQFGEIDRYTVLQAKGVEYSLKDLVPSEQAELFADGTFITLYLSPGDYHRIHAPLDGKITGFFHIPGKLYTVQEFMVKGLAGLFSINERLITYISAGKKGSAALCCIGAMNVGRITLDCRPEISTNGFCRKRREVFFTKDEQVKIKAGDQCGVFHLGSTVVLLLSKGLAELEVQTGQKVSMGQRIGRIAAEHGSR